MIDTGNHYNDIISNIVEILDREKAIIGVGYVFASVPPFIDLSLFPVVCVTRQKKNVDNFVAVPGRMRAEVIIEIWLQLTEINLVDVKAIDHQKSAEIETKIGVLTHKIETILRKNRTLDGYCLESQLLDTDFRPRMQSAKPQTLVAGAVISMATTTKDIEVI